MKNTIFALIILVLVGAGGYYYMQKTSTGSDVSPITETATTSGGNTAPTTTQSLPVADKSQTVIGTSTHKFPIVAYHFGSGTKEILMIGGIHGGYEWNTALLAYEMIDYLKANPTAIPENVTVTIIPVLNPDGLAKVTGSYQKFSESDVDTSTNILTEGRFNDNKVDLNRNFDCDWKAKGAWQTKVVSGGTAPFSEPESKALKNYIDTHAITAAVAWFSQAGGVFASNCHTGVLPETTAIMQHYADGSGYPAHQSFDFYATTGDVVNWLAKKKIPAISVLLTNHTDTEFEKNKKGLASLLTYYRE